MSRRKNKKEESKVVWVILWVLLLTVLILGREKFLDMMNLEIGLEILVSN